MGISVDSTNATLQRLPEFLAKLHGAEFYVAPDQWIALEDLIFQLHYAKRLPKNFIDLKAYLAPIFCKSPEEQEVFYRLFLEWINEKEQIKEKKTKALDTSNSPTHSVTEHIATQEAVKTLKHANTRWRVFKVLIIAVFIVGLSVVYYRDFVKQTPDPIETPRPVPTTVPSAAPVNEEKTYNTKLLPVELSSVANESEIEKPIPLAELEGKWKRWFDIAKFSVFALPLLILTLWLMNLLWRRRVILEKYKSETIDPLKKLVLNLGEHYPFSEKRIAIPLRKTVKRITRRIHSEKTVEKTVQHAGFFHPVYAERRSRPEYLMLIDRTHAYDHRAALAIVLAKQLQARGVLVHCYEFFQDPKMCYVLGSRKAVTLKSLAHQFGEANLFVTGDAEGLFHPIKGELYSFVSLFEPWQIRVWLSTKAHPWGYQEAQLVNSGFTVAPLSGRGMESVIGWLKQPKTKVWFQPSSEQNFPNMLSHEYDAWLSRRQPSYYDSKELRRQLRRYLGMRGYILLVACAAYPEMVGNLSLALDQQLFPDASLQEREQRLLKHARLPWCHKGSMPDYLREDLINNSSEEQQQRIAKAYDFLFNQATLTRHQAELALPFTPAQAQQTRDYIKDLLRFSPSGTNLSDQLFAQVIFSTKRSLLDFELPKKIASLLPGKRWQWGSFVLPILVGLLCSAALWSSWYWFAGTTLERYLQSQMPVEETFYEVSYASEQQALANNFKNAMANLGVANLRLTARAAEPVTNNDWQATKIYYSIDKRAEAQNAKQTLQRVQQGPGDIRLIEHTSDVVRIDLGSPAVFYEQWQLDTHPDLSTFNDSLSSGGQGPTMVVIPAGNFQMGSPEGEGVADEWPQRLISVQKFALMQTEVTFDDWDKCVAARACNNARVEKAGGDENWGKGQRPVINVAWQDAQDYAQWLSAETGFTYRLPSEAEWEYAARAGTVTKYSWGDEPDGKYANGGQKYGWPDDGFTNRTAPVANYLINPWELYDMHGNVWEWVEDCWHEDYTNAPADGRAWLEENNGNCNRRVVRGGSWFNYPENLRSANRNRYNNDERYNSLGFRLARTLGKE